MLHRYIIIGTLKVRLMTAKRAEKLRQKGLWVEEL